LFAPSATHTLPSIKSPALPTFRFTNGHAPFSLSKAPPVQAPANPLFRHCPANFPAFLVGQFNVTSPCHPPHRHPMSYPAIYIALQGKTSHVPPRYIPCDLAGIIPKSVSGSCDLMVRYSRSCICHTEFGIREPEIGNRGTGKFHGAVFSLLTTGMMGW
jgi:hypothetical protein